MYCPESETCICEKCRGIPLVDPEAKRVMRELNTNKKDKNLFIGQWKPKVNDKGEQEWIQDGRCIHFNNMGTTLYVGFMKAGLRHGWGIETPIRSKHLRPKYRVTNFRYGKRIIPRDNDD